LHLLLLLLLLPLHLRLLLPRRVVQLG